MPLHFPTARLSPAEQDRTEGALYDAFLVAQEFRHALADASTVGRAMQIRERLKAVLQDFHSLENDAAAKSDALCRG